MAQAVAQGTTSSASAAASTAATSTAGRPVPTAADIAFMQGMIGHHSQALTMVALMGARTRREPLLQLGERIAVSQRDEIATMRRWLQDHGATVPDSAMGAMRHAGMDHAAMDHAAMDHAAMASGAMTHDMPGMPGMLTAAQMDSLTAATGDRFDQLFLRYMIQHHDGALTMVRQLLGTPGAAQDPQVYSFVADVDTDQRAEIRRMQALLTTLRRPRTKR
ncbi:MAG: DUF305 domain-containing protein [Gemmatimonadaceae bacterium]